MNSVTIAFTIISGILVVVLPKRQAILPVLLASTVVPLSAVIDWGALTFPVIRILLIFAAFRILTRGEHVGFEFNLVDKAVVWFALAIVLTGLAPREDLSFIFRLGKAYDTIGFYFVFRILVRSREEMLSVAAGLAVFMTLLAVAMLFERHTMTNVFNFFGSNISPMIRDGKVRAQGAFSHAILAGTIGATTIGIFLGSWLQSEKLRKFFVVGGLSCIVVVFSCASSGPIMSGAFLILGLLTWFARSRLGMVRLGIVLLLVGLQVTMKAPIWYLIGRIDLTGSSTGFHRAELINSAVKYFGEWWLVGTDYTRHWMATGVTWSPRHTDITNHFLAQGVNGGLPQLITFVLIIINAFRYVGTVVRSLEENDLRSKFLMWCFGAVLFAHTVTFFSVSYFDQSSIFFTLNLAIIASGEFLLMTQSQAEHIALSECQNSLLHQ